MLKEIFFYTLVCVCIVESIFISFYYKKISINSFYYNKGERRYLILNENNEEIVNLIFSEDNTIKDFSIDDKKRFKIMFSYLGGDRENIYICDKDMPFQVLEQINLTNDVILDRQELMNSYQRHYQILRDGSIQQRRADFNNQVWHIEVPYDGFWKELFTFELFDQSKAQR